MPPPPPPPGTGTKAKTTLSSCATLFACALACLVSVRLLRGPARWEAGANYDHYYDDEPPKLVTYAQFRRTLMRTPADSLVEHSARALLFAGNLGEIGRHNLASLSGLETYYIGQSPFKSDLTRGEQEALEVAPVSISGGDGGGATDRPVGAGWAAVFGGGKGAGAYRLDANQADCLGHIRSQGACGACYAFSLMSLAEWHFCKQTPERRPVDFAEQFLVDCGHKSGLNGCKEGRLSQAKDFILFNGVKWERDYPYTGAKAKSCTHSMLNDKAVNLRISNWRRIPIKRDVFEATLREQPILVEAALPADFKSYSGGIHSGKNCRESMRHGVLLVGYGERDGKPFWLVRNSYGPKWGSDGFMRISRDMPNMNKCFPSAFVAKFHFDDLPEDAAENFYARIKYQPPEEELKLALHGVTRSLVALNVLPKGANEADDTTASDKTQSGS